MISLYFNYLLKDPIFNYSHVLRSWETWVLGDAIQLMTPLLLFGLVESPLLLGLSASALKRGELSQICVMPSFLLFFLQLGT